MISLLGFREQHEGGHMDGREAAFVEVNIVGTPGVECDEDMQSHSGEPHGAHEGNTEQS